MEKEQKPASERTKTKINKIISITKIIISAITIAFIIEFFGTKGVIGIMTVMILIALYKLWIFREQFIGALRYIETMIYKKPLDKEYWKKGELKRKKIKIKWRKK